MPGHERCLKHTVRPDIARSLQRNTGKNWKRIEEQKEFSENGTSEDTFGAGIAGCL